MNPIKSLFIPCVELYVDANFIVNLFYENNIATIKSVTFENNGSPYKMAYVDIYEWHDTEIAYNFIKRLHNRNIETKLIHSDDDWWVVKINFKKEEFYLNQDNTFINYLVLDKEQYQNEDYNKEDYNKDFMGNQKGRELLSYLNQSQDKKQDIQDWNEIENLLDISLKCFRLDFIFAY